MLRRSQYLPCLLTLFLVGCSGGVKPEVVPPLEPVSGTVNLDGKPTEGISVTFFPLDKGNPAYGTTDASGKYTLNYRTGSPGIPAGNYVALFSKLTLPDGSPLPANQTAADAGAIDQIPEQYRSTSDPTNAVTVPQGGKTFDFELRSK